ncbi:MAG: 1-(5-phosphoribosyl)-5-[(5-phosphoribosylamino)methylideneamino] imidazole-4-carboxamide isomerase [Candidatus Acidoferrum typicum]|nr:1-(5-phosphoribosyl)-5-[(5-phosphoribosylamino)methylideneamino] imidazole-4-carboxamide isomerase [Candidatus Acidoferrum typicum]
MQLVHGRRRELAIADVMSLLLKFKKYKWLHIIDLDAAMGKGNNSELARKLCDEAAHRYGMKVRVGGGIRTLWRAEEITEWGAQQVIVGSAAFQDGKINRAFLRRLRTRVGRPAIVVALDTCRGHIVIKGWREKLRIQAEQVMEHLEPFCAAFLCTDVDREGTMSGANREWFERLRSATSHPIIAAGGIKAQREIDALERIGIDAAVGMALYKDRLH